MRINKKLIINKNLIIKYYNLAKETDDNKLYNIPLLMETHRDLNEIEAFILMYFLNFEICSFGDIKSDYIKVLLDRYDVKINEQEDVLLKIIQTMNSINDNCRPNSANGGFYKQKVVKVIRKY
jgi:hypothetical protein